MGHYKFTIGVSGTRGITEELRQKLVEAGCEDIILEADKGEVLLIANRRARGFARALKKLEDQINSITLADGTKLSISSYRIYPVNLQ